MGDYVYVYISTTVHCILKMRKHIDGTIPAKKWMQKGFGWMKALNMGNLTRLLFIIWYAMWLQND